MLNKVMLIGNVGVDPEVRYLENPNPNQGGTTPKVATFRMATTERFRDRNGEPRERTEWHNIVAWRQLADVCERFVRRGTQIYVEGRLTTRSWDDKDGNKRYQTEIVADNLQLLGRRQDNPGLGDQPQPQPAPQPAPQPKPQPQPAVQSAPQAPAPVDFNMTAPDDDLPF